MIFGRTASKVLAALFLAALVFPGAAAALNWGVSAPLDENRAAAPRPSFVFSRYTEFPKAFDHYADDHLPFRKQLIVFHHALQLRLFKTDETAHLILGKKGWMYYVSGDEMKDFLGAKPFTAAELEAIVSRIERRAKQCEENGIVYLFVVAPNKQSVYPEFLPERYASRQGRTRLDQLKLAMANHPSVHFLDPRHAFEAAKKSHEIYFKTDSHWNAYGAWTVYREIVSNLQARFPDLEMPALEDYKITEKPNTGEGDLARMAAMKGLLEDKSVELSPKMGIKFFPRPVRALGDSFINPIVAYFPQNFEGRPDVIVDEVAERYLPSLLKDGFHDLQF